MYVCTYRGHRKSIIYCNATETLTSFRRLQRALPDRGRQEYDEVRDEWAPVGGLAGACLETSGRPADQYT
eukprot:9029041-Heterocapsa_arctica.AAC.1